MRRDILRRLAGHRYLLTPGFAGQDGEVWVALNEVAVAFVDDELVMKALSKFQCKVERRFCANDLFQLMSAMAEAAELPSESLDTAQIENPFVPRAQQKSESP